MKKNENFLPLVQAVQAVVDRLISLKITKEDPYGHKRFHTISGVRIAYLSYESSSIRYLNGISGPNIKKKDIPEMLITLFYNTTKKVVNVPIPVQSPFLMTPEGLLSEVWPILALSVDELFDEFYASRSEENRFYQETFQDPIAFADEDFQINSLPPLSNKLQASFLELVRDCYLVPQILRVDASLASKRKLWIVVDSYGSRILQKQDTVEASLTLAFVDKQKRVFNETVAKIYRYCKELISEMEIFRSYCQQLIASIDRRQLPSGIYPLILAPSAVGTLFHEALAGHMLSGSFVANEDSTVFKGKIGKQIAKNGFMEILNWIQVWDCPLDSGMIASYRYDMEGIPAQDVCLIDHGVLNAYLLDRNSAQQLRQPNNGHALSGGFMKQVLSNFMIIPEAQLPEPRVSNLQIGSESEYSLEEMKSDFLKEFGFYLWVESSAGQVNIETGTFTLTVNCLVKVSKGGKREYFSGGSFSSNLTDFLSAIQVVSNHYGRIQGYCGSNSGWVPTEGYCPAMGAYGINWIPAPLPEKERILDPKRDKYIPENWATKISSFEV